MIGRSGERGSGLSVLTARHDDDDDDVYQRFISYLMRKFHTNQLNTIMCLQNIILHFHRMHVCLLMKYPIRTKLFESRIVT